MSSESTHPSYWTRFGRFLVRLTFAIVLGILLGAGIYYGATALYHHYIQSVQENNLRLNTLEARQEQYEQQTIQRLDDLANRLVTLEVQNDTNKATLADLMARLTVVETTQADQVDISSALQTDATDIQTGLAALRGDIDSQQKDLATLIENLTLLKAEIDPALQSINENSQTLANLTQEIQVDADRWLTLQKELELIKVMELLTRSRMYLAQGNLGLARADIMSGRDLLVTLQSEVPAYQLETLTQIVAQLDAALTNLPRSPLSAADRLEGAWQLLIQGLPGEPTSAQQLSSTETPQVPSLEITETPPTPIFTPTPSP